MKMEILKEIASMLNPKINLLIRIPDPLVSTLKKFIHSHLGGILFENLSSDIPDNQRWDRDSEAAASIIRTVRLSNLLFNCVIRYVNTKRSLSFLEHRGTAGQGKVLDYILGLENEELNDLFNEMLKDEPNFHESMGIVLWDCFEGYFLKRLGGPGYSGFRRQ